MPVVVEGISVLLRREAIERKYKGGWNGFAGDVPNQTLCADAEVARVGFMSPVDVVAYLEGMARHGLVFRDETGAAVEMAVFDQHRGSTRPCAWIECFRQEMPGGGTILCARLKGSQDTNIVCPEGSTYERSLSKSSVFVPTQKIASQLEFLRHEGGLDVYRRRSTGEIVYVGRPLAPAN